MDIASIAPFLRSTERVFSTMLQLGVDCAAARHPGSAPARYPIAVVVEQAGDGEGVLVAGFELAVAERIAALFTGAEPSGDADALDDALRELVEMIGAGGFRGRVDLSPPVVRRDVDLGAVLDGASVMAATCDTPCGSFELMVSPASSVDAARLVSEKGRR